jgi:hypothetical protein
MEKDDCLIRKKAMMKAFYGNKMEKLHTIIKEEVQK